MAITFNYHLDSKQTRNKTIVIYLYITQDGKSLKIKSPVELSKKSDFNPQGKKNFSWVRASEPRHKKWNEELEEFLDRANRIKKQLEVKSIATKEKIKEILISGERTESFLAYIDEFIQRIDVPNTATKYIGFQNKLKNYLNGRDLLFAEIDLAFLIKFQSHRV